MSLNVRSGEGQLPTFVLVSAPITVALSVISASVNTPDNTEVDVGNVPGLSLGALNATAQNHQVIEVLNVPSLALTALIADPDFETHVFATRASLAVGGTGFVHQVSAQPFVPTQFPLFAGNRFVDWSYAGATSIDNARTKSGSTIAAYTGSPTTIENAFAAAGSEQYVELGSGTFNLNACVNLSANNRTLRGQGPQNTILNITSSSGHGLPWGWASSCLVIAGSPNYSGDRTPSMMGAPSTTSFALQGTNGNSGVFAKGATVLNLSGGTWTVGDVVCITQNNKASGSLPSTGYFWSSKVDNSGTTDNGISWQGAYEDFGATLQQRSVVTAVSGSNITINPPLAHGLWDATLSPRVYRYTSGIYTTGIGIENLTIRTTGLTVSHVVALLRAKNCWLKNVAIIPNTSGADYGVSFHDSLQCSLRDYWMEPVSGGGAATTTTYGVNAQGSQFLHISNGVMNGVESPVTLNVGSMGCVIDHIYEINTGGEGGFDNHQPGVALNLIEACSWLKVTGDLFHGNSMINTAFRNHCYNRGFDLQSYHRYWNIVGNVIHATAVRKTLPTDGTLYNRFASFGFRLGYPGQNASASSYYNGSGARGVRLDVDTSTTAMIWGNYTTTGGTQFNASEVPSADAFLPNPVPATNDLPASLFYTSAPYFYSAGAAGSVPFPCIGPDVTDGSFEGGRAYKIPAQLMYEHAGGNVANFNPALYGT